MPPTPSTEPVTTRTPARVPKNRRALMMFIHNIVENAMALSADVM
jgi:hypothetical protein